MKTGGMTTLLLIAALIALVAVPFALKPPMAHRPADSAPLIIISPHNEAVRFEFETAFDRWHREHFGASAAIDWRNIGGTSEIARYLDGEFTAADRAGRAGIGIDLLFGGGQYDHARQARLNHTSPSRIRQTQPKWFDAAIIPAIFSGETFYDPAGHWFGCCLSSFGICYNTDALADLGITNPPATWKDLADVHWRGRLALADPTKSGSINKAFEALIQSEMDGCLRRNGIAPDRASINDLAAGWRDAWQLLGAIGANARYFTDSASKVPMDVAQGNAAAGMCIDFYGRFESETVQRNENSTRLHYITPDSGSSLSVDPISLLRGAPHMETAERFIEFCLSSDGQKLWNYRPGTPGGPVRHALRRLPVRRDFYTAKHLHYMSDPDALPYERTGDFVYHPAWTAPLFGRIRILMRAMCLDTHDELVAAWSAVTEGMTPETVAAARAALTALPESAEYQALHEAAGKPWTRSDELSLAQEWLLFFRQQYMIHSSQKRHFKTTDTDGSPLPNLQEVGTPSN